MLELGRRVVEGDGGEVEVDGAGILSGLFADYFEVWEEVAYSPDEHSLYLVVCLRGEMLTSVTGSLMPFSYFLSSGF